VVPHSEDGAPVLDSESDWPHDQPKSSSDSEPTVTQFTQPEPTAVKTSASNLANMEPSRDERFSRENVNSISNIENMLAQVLVVMQANCKEVLEKLEMSNKEMQSKLESNGRDLQSKIESSNKALQGLQEIMEKVLKSEIEKINLRSEKENQQLDKRFSDKVENSTRMLKNKIENVQELLEAELMAAKNPFEVADRKLESEFYHQISQAHLRMDELASRAEGIRVEVNTRVNQLGIKVTQVDSKVGSLDN
jgi:paraquat-inducible protein B